MMIAYYLSARQSKELLTRGCELRLAIPEPPGMDDDADPLEFARASFPSVEPHHVVAAEWDVIWIGPDTGGPGLTGSLGAILDSSQAVGTLSRSVAVCVAVLRTPHCRHSGGSRIQWPGSARLGELRWPWKEGADGDQA